MLRAWRHWQAAQRETHALLTFWDRRQLAGWRAGLPVLRLATRKDGLSHLVSLARLKRECACAWFPDCFVLPHEAHRWADATNGGVRNDDRGEMSRHGRPD